MFVPVICLVIGIAVLVWSADKFVDGASGLAKSLGVSSFLIGAIVVGFGTSAPEITVSIFAALGNTPELALGNAYGSNITNIALILGVTAVFCPVPMPRNVVLKDLLYLIIATAVSLAVILNQEISRVNGLMLIGIFAAILALQICQGLKEKTVVEDSPEGSLSTAKSWLWLIVGLVLLVGSSKLLVYGATEIAKAIGVSDLVIGLTVVAVGTSLPELASSIIAARKGDTALALGNVIGSNLFNTLLVVGIPSLICPMHLDPMIIVRDFPIMAFLTLLLFPLGFRFKERSGRVGRLAGGFLVAVYVGYVAYLVLTATASAA